MTLLKHAQCQPCRADSAALSHAELTPLLTQLDGWQLVTRAGVSQLEKHFTFTDFKQALAFTNAVAALAEAENHHPALLTEWGKVGVTWWTHSIRGLHLNDLIMAARTDALCPPSAPNS